MSGPGAPINLTSDPSETQPLPQASFATSSPAPTDKPVDHDASQVDQRAPKQVTHEQPGPENSGAAPLTDTAPLDNAARGHAAAAATGSSELARAKEELMAVLRRFPDFPIPGILFVDIMPLFRSPATQETLLRALELQVRDQFVPAGDSATATAIDVVVGLDARGFLFGPALAMRLGAAFVPVRKKGKLPGPCVTAEYKKEYGADFFQMQADAIVTGQRVLVVDDIIATGESLSRSSPWSPRVWASVRNPCGCAISIRSLDTKWNTILRTPPA